MSPFKFAEVPSNDTVASLVTFLVSAWFVAAGGAMLSEPAWEAQSRAFAKTPEVTVKQISVTQAEQPDAKFTIQVVAQRLPKVS